MMTISPRAMLADYRYMRIIAIILLLGLVGCQKGNPDNESAGADSLFPTSAFHPRGGLIKLTGLYESGKAPNLNRLCIVGGRLSGHFAMVVWSGSARSCSGSGTVARRLGGLRFAMTGDSSCAFRARIHGRTIVFPTRLPAGCAYYCGDRASAAGARLTRTDATRDGAMKAKDLVGESLCEGMEE